MWAQYNRSPSADNGEICSQFGWGGLTSNHRSAAPPVIPKPTATLHQISCHPQ
ncbi:MAG: hypothetical protein F6K17_24700 [Okeania sp. SIO3C4]|nr:hypothetical protein [Okeania sp. SIO3C4]